MTREECELIVEKLIFEKAKKYDRLVGVLDKIRADISKLQTYKMFEGEDTVYIERDDVLDIIDKHTKELLD